MERRPSPDEALARAQEEEARRRRGSLRIFFGAAPGVGKTFAMLEMARQKRAEGLEVVAGWVQTHGRAETEALLEGLERLPPRLLSYHGRRLEEFDLDAALGRRPGLILVDELAHTNAPGSRHLKRWRDVEELLQAGISVVTTLNVQHLESLNDVIAQVTGVTVRERVPDSFFMAATEVDLVDLSPDDLLRRLREGKVYIPEDAARAAQNFFRPGNLIALRELALRKTAERVDAQMVLYRRTHAVQETWPTAERVLVCLGPSPYGQRLVRAAHQLARQLNAQWLAVYVETPAHARLGEEDLEQLHRTMRLAEQLGAEVVTLTGRNQAEEILAYGRSRNVTKIVLGKPPRLQGWRRWSVSSFFDELARGSDRIDVYLIGGTGEARVQHLLAAIRRPGPRPARLLPPYLWAGATAVACTLVSALLARHVDPVNLAMVFLVGVVFAATRFGTGPAVLASLLSVLAFDFFFIPPYLTFAVGDAQYFITFLVFLGVALLTSNLASRVRQQAEMARQSERRTLSLYELAQDLVRAVEPEEVAQTAGRHLHEHYGMQAAVHLAGEGGELGIVASFDASFAHMATEMAMARWVAQNGQAAGLGTESLPGSAGFYLPLQASSGILGVLALRPADPEAFNLPGFRRWVEAVAHQSAVALERAVLARRARQAQLEAESERLRSSLLSTVSHDFRTPLASILGASTTLLGADLAGGDTRELVETIHEEAEHLHRLITNLLAVTRLESGKVDLHMEWQPLEEVVGAALGRLRDELGGRPLVLDIPEDLPAVAIDAPLVEQVFINILENAAKYTPGGNPLEIHARGAGKVVEVQIADRGPGLPEEAVEKIFDKFYRASESRPGAGLGLAICQAIVRAHGGTIRASNRPGGGALFTFTLPVAPPIPEEARAGGASKAEEEA